MVTKLLRKVKLLKNDGDKAVVRSPEKVGVGGSTPSLATNQIKVNDLLFIVNLSHLSHIS